MVEEMSVEEFKRRGLKIPRARRPDTVFPRFISAVGAYCIEKRYDLPTKEYRFHPPRKWRFDLGWPRYQVAFEYEGGTWASAHDPDAKSRHTTGEGYRNDCEKYSQAAIDGWTVIRATSDMLKDGTAIDLLARALAVGLARAGSTGYEGTGQGGHVWEAPPSRLLQSAARRAPTTRRAQSSPFPTTRPRSRPERSR